MSVLSIGIERTRTVDDIIAEYFRLVLEDERKTRYSLIDDKAFSLLTDTRFRLIERDGRFYMELIGSPHVWRCVFQEFPYLPTPEELEQARDLISRKQSIYQDAIIGFAKLVREYNLK